VDDPARQIETDGVIAALLDFRHPFAHALSQAGVLGVRPVEGLDPLDRQLAAVEGTVLVQKVLVDGLRRALPHHVEDINVAVLVFPVVPPAGVGTGLDVAGVHAETPQDLLVGVRHRMDDRHGLGRPGHAQVGFQPFVGRQGDGGEFGAAEIDRHPVRLLMFERRRDPFSVCPAHGVPPL
jgi:hypothetical protein